MATPVQFANGPLPQAPNTTLTASIPSSGGGTVTVASALYLPAVGPFLIVVENERIEVASISGTTLTFAAGGRGQEGTTAAAHASGAAVYQVLSAATLARHIDDRAAKGWVDYAQKTTDTTLSTTAGTYTVLVTGNAVAVQGGRRYRITASGGFDLLAAGSGFATGDTWQQKLEIDEGSGFGALPVFGGPFLIARSMETVSQRFPLPPIIAYYMPAADDTVTLRWAAAKTSGAAAVTSTVEAGAGLASLALLVEDVGAV